MSDYEYLVSVVVPTHGRRDMVLRLLDALARQSLPAGDFEILIVHNFTADGTAEAVQDWIESAPMKASYHRKNYSGPAASRQFGADHARGRYIAFIDDDCIPQPDWLEQGMARFDDGETPAVGLVQGKTLPNPGQRRRLLEKTILIDQASIFFETCNIFYTRSAFNQVGGFSAEFMDRFYGEDTDLGWKIKMSGLRTRFAARAVVYHEVFHVTIWSWLKEALHFKNIPYLAKKFPEFRRHMYRRYFLTVETACFNLLLLGLLGSPVTPYSLILALPYFYRRYRSGAHLNNPMLRLLRIAAGLPRSLLVWVALVSGSLRARSLLI